MLLTIRIPTGPLAGRRRVIARDEPERISVLAALAYSNNPTLEYTTVARHNGEQIGDLFGDAHVPAKRTQRKASPIKSSKPMTWAMFFRKYRNVDDYLREHPGPIGTCHNPPSEVRYFTTHIRGPRPIPNYVMNINGTWNHKVPEDAVPWDSWREACSATLEDHTNKAKALGLDD